MKEASEEAYQSFAIQGYSQDHDFTGVPKIFPSEYPLNVQCHCTLNITSSVVHVL